MPFDGADYRHSNPETPRRSTISDTALSYAIGVFAAVMLLMPVSLGALIDIIKYFEAAEHDAAAIGIVTSPAPWAGTGSR